MCRILIFSILLSSFSLYSVGQNRSSKDEMHVFIDQLMSKMTIEEKIGQLNLLVGSGFETGEKKSEGVAEKVKAGSVGALLNVQGVENTHEIQRIAVEQSRLGIPLLFGRDVIHGHKTLFPVPIALACSWDMEAIEKTARISAIEASADGINWTYSPMADIGRDPRWGRVVEGAGEDPFLSGEVTKAMIRGYQGDNTFQKDDEIAACVKHFALYGASESGRDYNTVDMSRIRMYNEYFPPYKAAIDAGVLTVMTSFNEVDGIPATGNKWLLTDVLRNQWGFNGFVVSDYTSMLEMINHGMGNLKTVSELSIKAGMDMDMVSEGYYKHLKQSIEEGKVDIKLLDASCRRILEIKYILGLFKDPYKFGSKEKSETLVFTQENKNAARDIASKSFVLLKNDNNTLPLIQGKKLAVIGPLANTKANMVGTWSPSADLEAPTSVLEAISKIKGTTVKYAKGSNLTADKGVEKRATRRGRSLGRNNMTDAQLQEEALKIAKESDIIVAVMGEATEMNGEAACRSNIEIPDVQKALLKELKKCGKPIVLVLFTGRPLDLSWENENIDAILNVWFGGTMAAEAIGDVLYGVKNPSGKLVMSFPQNIGQVPIFYNHKMTGRPAKEEDPFRKFRSNYIDVTNAPLYPFGYGLSYTKFEYGKAKLDKTTMRANEKIKLTVPVKNIGKREGQEIVQLYIRDLVGSVTRPVKELKAYEKINLQPGESKLITFEINTDMLKFYNYDLDYVYENGKFEVMVGPNSRDLESLSFRLE